MDCISFLRVVGNAQWTKKNGNNGNYINNCHSYSMVFEKIGGATFYRNFINIALSIEILAQGVTL